MELPAAARTQQLAHRRVLSRAELDNRGRLANETASDPANGDLTQERTYDTAGAVNAMAVPHRVGVSPTYVTYSNTRMDSRTINLPEGMAINQQNDLDSVQIQQYLENRYKRYYYNEDGKIINVVEQDGDTGGLNVVTAYYYDVLGHLTAIGQGIQTRTFVYDDLGRLKSETHPETGTTTYSYDAASNRISRTDSRGITTTYTYDELNRIAQKTYSDGTPGVSYVYDAQPSGSPITTANPLDG